VVTAHVTRLHLAASDRTATNAIERRCADSCSHTRASISFFSGERPSRADFAARHEMHIYRSRVQTRNSGRANGVGGPTLSKSRRCLAWRGPAYSRSRSCTATRRPVRLAVSRCRATTRANFGGENLARPASQAAAYVRSRSGGCGGRRQDRPSPPVAARLRPLGVDTPGSSDCAPLTHSATTGRSATTRITLPTKWQFNHMR